MHRLEITLPLPPKELAPNFRKHKHWGSRSRATKAARGDAYLAALDAIARQKPRGLPWGAATVRGVFYLPPRWRGDKTNLQGWLKAYEDGVQDAGVVVNDEVFVPLPPEVNVDKADPRVVLVVEMIETSGP